MNWQTHTMWMWTNILFNVSILSVLFRCLLFNNRKEITVDSPKTTSSIARAFYCIKAHTYVQYAHKRTFERKRCKIEKLTELGVKRFNRCVTVLLSDREHNRERYPFSIWLLLFGFSFFVWIAIMEHVWVCLCLVLHYLMQLRNHAEQKA